MRQQRKWYHFMPDLKDGETAEMQGSGAKPYVLKNNGGVYSCSCPAWRNQSIAIEKRTCKHLRKLRGDAAEEARTGGALPQRPARAKAGGDGENEEDAGPPLLLAESWDNAANLSDWWMSDKLDGVRAYWDGIGTGFSDRERENPPAVGATVTFRYQELSDAGVPRFPSWVGVRHDVAIKDARSAPMRKPQSSTLVTIVGSAGTATKPRYFEFIEGNSSKFWEVSQSGNAMTTRWGRIGSAGQSKTKTFSDEQAAANAAALLIEEKTDEGYVEKTT